MFKNLFKNTSKDQPILVDVDKELNTFSKAQTIQAEKTGRDVATHNPPKTTQTLLRTPDFMVILNAFDSKLSEISVLFTKELENLKTRYQQLYDDFTTNEEIKNAKTELDTLKTEEAESLAEAVRSHDETISDKREENDGLRGDIKNFKLKLRNMTKHRLWPRYAIGSIIMLLIALGEIHLNADAFEYTGLTETYAKFVGIAVATVTFMLGIALSFVIRKEEWEKNTKTYVSLGIIALVCGLYYTLGSIRISMMESQGASEGLFDLSAFHFVVFNLAFFTAIFCTKYFILPSPLMMKNNAEYGAEETKLHQAEKKFAHNRKEIEQAHLSREQTKKRVKSDFKARIDLAKSKIQEKVKDIETTTQKYNTLLSRGTQFYKQINADSKTVIAKFFSVVNLYRNDKISLDIPTLEGLENPFTQYHPIKTFEEIQTGETTPEAPTSHPKPSETPSVEKENKEEEEGKAEAELTQDDKTEPNTTQVDRPVNPSNFQWNTSANTMYSFTNSKS